MSQNRIKLNIPGMCNEGPPSYSELDMDQGSRLRREKALTQIEENRTYCAHFSSTREIIKSQELEKRIRRYEPGDHIDVEYLHEVPADTPQDPRNLWLRKQDPTTGAVTVINANEDPWDLDVILFLRDGLSPVDAEVELLEIYTAMVVGFRSRDRHLSDDEALERAKQDVDTAITYVLARIEAIDANLDEETKHQLTMVQLRMMPEEMLDRAYNRYRLEHHGIDLDDHPQYRSYQTFYEMGIAPPSHEKMAAIIIKALT